jgi:hypothetical protein
MRRRSCRPCPPADNAGDLARELAGAFGRLVEEFREFFELSPEEARARACEAQPEHLDRILTGPPDQVSWFDLDTLSRHDSKKARERWQQVKTAARRELQNGHRAARTVESTDRGRCWERAQFHALRAGLEEEWRPWSALERELIDQLAQHRTMLERWQTTLTAWTGLTAEGTRRDEREEDPFEPPRVSNAEALEIAARMVEQFSHLYLRTLRALQDQRRLAAPVVVRRANQVNIAGQPVNLAW